jgi:hypothetical protein
MVTTAKQISRDKFGREVLYFDVPEKTGIVSVIGADTYLGVHMVKELIEARKTVYGFTQEKDFKFSLKPISEHEVTGLDYPPHPILSDWLVICIDPRIEFEKYTSKIRNLSNYLYRKKYRGDLLFFSSAEICQPGEDGFLTTIAPRTEKDLNLATAENILNVMLYKPGNEVLPHVVRLGDSEIDEACTKTVEMMESDFCPDIAAI